jgi:single-stranded-DNA-specific exonuclease
LNPTDVHWQEPEQADLSADVLQAAGGNTLLARALIRRKLFDPEHITRFLNSARYNPTSPRDLPDLDAAAEILVKALQNQQTIGIWGDFDVDGQTATTLLYQTFHKLGGKAIYHIPVRSRESHGVNLPGLKDLLEQGAEIVVTCDTGITANDAAEFLREKNIPFIITDHHTLPELLPNADAVVNPQRLPPEHPLSYLCGVGAAYMLAAELFRRFDRLDEAAGFLDLVALGTIADLAILKGDNRYLVQLGLQSIRTHPRPALQAIFSLTETNPSLIDEEHISFLAAPRLNALGRLSDANLAVPFLCAENMPDALPFARELETMNNQRRLLTEQVFQAAQAQIKHNPALLGDAILVLNHPTWPGGVIGIVASKLAGLYHRPAMMIANPPGEPARGSARSIEGFNITGLLAASQKELITFGGHPMAAGFSLLEEKIPALRAVLNQEFKKIAGNEPVIQEWIVDAFISLDQLSLNLVDELEKLAPFGPGNPAVVLACRDLMLKSYSVIGKTGEHLQLLVEDSAGLTRKIIWWQGVGNPLPEGRFDLAFSVRASDYRGERALQIEWIHARSILAELPVQHRRPHVKYLDFRQILDPEKELQTLVHQQGAVIWAEGDNLPKLAFSNRFQLVPTPGLALWSIPPGLAELRSILESTGAAQVAFFGIRPSRDQAQEILTRVAGLLRQALRTADGRLELNQAAAALCQRTTTIHRAVEWWIAHGDLHAIQWDEQMVQVTAGGSVDHNSLARVEVELTTLLKETSAFRSYYLRAVPEQLLE